MTPVNTRASTIKKPQGSSFPRAMDCRAGSRLDSIRPPSSGGSGNKLKTSNPRFQVMPACAIEMKNFSLSPNPIRQISKIAQIMAWKKLEPGPANATQIESILGFLSRPKLTGTGLAYPTKNGDPVRISAKGIRMVPTGSICLAGFKLTRPSI